MKHMDRADDRERLALTARNEITRLRTCLETIDVALSGSRAVDRDRLHALVRNALAANTAEMPGAEGETAGVLE